MFACTTHTLCSKFRESSVLCNPENAGFFDKKLGELGFFTSHVSQYPLNIVFGGYVLPSPFLTSAENVFSHLLRRCGSEGFHDIIWTLLYSMTHAISFLHPTGECTHCPLGADWVQILRTISPAPPLHTYGTYYWYYRMLHLLVARFPGCGCC